MGHLLDYFGLPAVSKLCSWPLDVTFRAAGLVGGSGGKEGGQHPILVGWDVRTGIFARSQSYMHSQDLGNAELKAFPGRMSEPTQSTSET